MAAHLLTLSQSSLQDYVDCGRRFQLRYLERLSYPAEESEPALENERHMREGEEFHRLIQRHLLGIPAIQLERHANTEVLQRWWRNYLSDAMLQKVLEGALVLPEAGLSAPLGSFRLVAKFDLIAAWPDGKVTIYDWKTYRRRPRTEWLAARLQTRIYRALLTKAGLHLNGDRPIPPAQVEMIYWFADFPSEPAHFPYDEHQARRDWSMLADLADEISSAKEFPLTDDRQRCSYCPYRSLCNRGVQAGAGEEGEGEVEIEDIRLEQIQEIEF